jgi:hypothetical protein
MKSASLHFPIPVGVRFAAGILSIFAPPERLGLWCDSEIALVAQKHRAVIYGRHRFAMIRDRKALGHPSRFEGVSFRRCQIEERSRNRRLI